MAPPSVALLPSKRHPVIFEGPKPRVSSVEEYVAPEGVVPPGSSSNMEPEEKEATPGGCDQYKNVFLDQKVNINLVIVALRSTGVANLTKI